MRGEEIARRDFMCHACEGSIITLVCISYQVPGHPEPAPEVLRPLMLRAKDSVANVHGGLSLHHESVSHRLAYEEALEVELPWSRRSAQPRPLCPAAVSA